MTDLCCRRLFTEWLELFCFTHELPRSSTAILPDKSVQNCAGSCAVVQPKLCEPQEEEDTFRPGSNLGRRVKKEELGTKGEGNDEVISFIYMFVLVEIENGLQYIYPI